MFTRSSCLCMYCLRMAQNGCPCMGASGRARRVLLHRALSPAKVAGDGKGKANAKREGAPGVAASRGRLKGLTVGGATVPPGDRGPPEVVASRGRLKGTAALSLSAAPASSAASRFPPPSSASEVPKVLPLTVSHSHYCLLPLSPPSQSHCACSRVIVRFFHSLPPLQSRDLALRSLACASDGQRWVASRYAAPLGCCPLDEGWGRVLQWPWSDS